MRAYIAGPMRGIPEFNAPAFRDAAARLRAAGHEVYSPVERNDAAGLDFTGAHGTPEEAEAAGFDLREAMAEELTWIIRHADAVYALPGWAGSRGSMAEISLAWALGIPVLELADDDVTRSCVVEPAHGGAA